MVEYSLEIVKRNGNTFRDGYKTLVNARKSAVQYIKKFGINTTFVNIIKVSKGSWERPIVERVDWIDRQHDSTDFDGWICSQYKKKGNSSLSTKRVYRLSIKTGKLLDYNSTWRYL